MEIAAYFGLFLSALVAATILPAQSEAVLVSMLLSQEYAAGLLLTVASVGNILGSVINWGLGLGVQRFKDRRWFPVSAGALVIAQERYQRYGKWSLLLSWAPIIGDPLTVVAGMMREPFLPFLALVTIAKVGRYLVVYWLTQGF